MLGRKTLALLLGLAAAAMPAVSAQGEPIRFKTIDITDNIVVTQSDKSKVVTLKPDVYYIMDTGNNAGGSDYGFINVKCAPMTVSASGKSSYRPYKAWFMATRGEDYPYIYDAVSNLYVGETAGPGYSGSYNYYSFAVMCTDGVPTASYSA